MFELRWTKEADEQYEELRADAQRSFARREAKKKKARCQVSIATIGV